jgi:hypothetical protein
MRKMRKILDLTGQKFGRLTAIKRYKENKRTYWLCNCLCGQFTKVELSLLRSGQTKSCGCIVKEKAKARIRRLENERFGNLTVLKMMDKNASGNYTWLCVCDCGKETIVSCGKLTSGHTKSCGCLWKKSITKHGLHGKPGYTAYLLTTPERKLKRYVGNRVREVMKSRNVKKNGNVFDYLPYNADELKKHLESLWEPWMDWDNYGGMMSDERKTWHIDHIIPQSKFNYKSLSDPLFQDCWALTNLRPLEKMANCKKRCN